MTPLEKLQQHLNVTITNWDSPNLRPDLQLTEYMTADNYNVYILTEDPSCLNWENDVYYYEPDFNTIMDRIVEVAEDIPQAIILMDDVEQYLEDYEIENWLNDNIDEKN